MKVLTSKKAQRYTDRLDKFSSVSYDALKLMPVVEYQVYGYLIKIVTRKLEGNSFGSDKDVWKFIVLTAD